MRKCVIILVAFVVSLAVNIEVASSKGDTTPSEDTWAEIQSMSSTEDATSPSLRAAPPDGPAIGETPLGEASVAGLLLIGLAYFFVKLRKVNRRTY